METVSKLPDKKPVIGVREIVKGINSGKIKEVVVANNCPEFLVKKINIAGIKQFEGNEKELATKLGKPYLISMAGFE